MPRTIRKLWRSPLGSLVVGLIWIFLVPVVVYGTGGSIAAWICVGIGVLLILHAATRVLRRRLGGGPAALLVAAVLVALAVPVVAKANPADGCDSWGCDKIADPIPFSSVTNWSQLHAPDELPPAGCRTLFASSIGRYPTIVISLHPFKASYKVSYVFPAQLKYCWAGDWVAHQDGTIDSVTNQKIITMHIKPLPWESIARGITSDQHYLKMKATWDDPQHSCMTVQVWGQAHISVPPIPHFILGFEGVVHPWVRFHSICNDGSVLTVDHDYDPF
jgi:hypothetical protein